MKPSAKRWGLALLATLFCSVSQGAALQAEAVPLGGNAWEYRYSLTNTLNMTIEQFSVFFDLGGYANLEVMASPDGWDSLAFQPDHAIPADGFFDALALGAGLASGEAVSGFVLRFDYLLPGAPGAQEFHIVDPVTFATLFSGSSTVTVVPLPAPVLLLASALLLGLRRRASS